MVWLSGCDPEQGGKLLIPLFADKPMTPGELPDPAQKRFEPTVLACARLDGSVSDSAWVRPYHCIGWIAITSSAHPCRRHKYVSRHGQD